MFHNPRFTIVTGVLLMSALIHARSRAATFEEELAFLQKHTEVQVLQDGPRKVVVSPKLQGRVLLSSYGGSGTPALGWINHAAFETPESQTLPFNNYGGAERFWLGPEAGQFALYFKSGAKQEPANWFVPKVFDIGAFEVRKSAGSAAVMHRDNLELDNAAGTHFKLTVDDRSIILMTRDQVEEVTGPVAGVDWVGFQSSNRIQNNGPAAWTPASGTVGIWTLGMFVGTPHTWVVVPIRASGSGPTVKHDYFGKVPAERLRQVKDKSVLMFRGDGKLRSKIGISPSRSLDIVGSIDFENNIVTLVRYDPPPTGEKRYVNNMWEVPQAEPFGGDAIQSYNDGTLGFYELETSSPAAFLGTGETLVHTSRTIHLHGPPEKLDPIIQRTFRATLAELKATVGE